MYTLSPIGCFHVKFKPLWSNILSRVAHHYSDSEFRDCNTSTSGKTSINHSAQHERLTFSSDFSAKVGRECSRLWDTCWVGGAPNVGQISCRFHHSSIITHWLKNSHLTPTIDDNSTSIACVLSLLVIWQSFSFTRHFAIEFLVFRLVLEPSLGARPATYLQPFFKCV